MSLRPAARPLRAALARPTVRTLSSTAPRRGGHDNHSAGSSEHNTNESFLNPTWRNTIIAFAAGYLIYSFAPSPVKGSASPSVSNDNVVAESKDQSVPFITRWLAGQMAGDGELWKKRSDKHLELASEVADTRLLFQEAERPKILRMKYPSSFEQASPNCIGVGTQANLSDLVVKTSEDV